MFNKYRFKNTVTVYNTRDVITNPENTLITVEEDKVQIVQVGFTVKFEPLKTLVKFIKRLLGIK